MPLLQHSKLFSITGVRNWNSCLIVSSLSLQCRVLLDQLLFMTIWTYLLVALPMGILHHIFYNHVTVGLPFMVTAMILLKVYMATILLNGHYTQHVNTQVQWLVVPQVCWAITFYHRFLLSDFYSAYSSCRNIHVCPVRSNADPVSCNLTYHQFNTVHCVSVIANIYSDCSTDGPDEFLHTYSNFKDCCPILHPTIEANSCWFPALPA